LPGGRAPASAALPEQVRLPEPAGVLECRETGGEPAPPTTGVSLDNTSASQGVALLRDQDLACAGDVSD